LEYGSSGDSTIYFWGAKPKPTNVTLKIWFGD